jgi:hypothetical protein
LVLAASGATWRATVPSYVAARTPWGDPDLQGAYTNGDERFTPMERPQAFAGRHLDDISPSELEELNRQRTERAPAIYELEPMYEQPLSRSRSGWLVRDPPSGLIPPWTEAARVRGAQRAEQLRRAAETRPWAAGDLFTRCVSRGLPGSMIPFAYGNTYEIFQGPGVVAITYEMVHETRVIALSAGPHVGDAIRSFMGDARGRFEGDSLVVETTNLNGVIPLRGSSDALRLVERFRPLSPEHLEWSVTLDDPATWARPWTFAMTLTRTTERPLEYACHEGNQAVRHALGGEGQ